jgi:hypothetical protein
MRKELVLIKDIVSEKKYKILCLLSGLAYWIVFAFSSGIFFYYPFDVFSIVGSSLIPNPLFYFNFSDFKSFYYSGIIWYPNGHFEIVLAIGPFVFSLILSILFSLNIVTIVYGFKFFRMRRGSGLSGLLGLIPALFSSGCCSIPIGFSIMGSFISLAGIRPILYIFYAYPEYVNGAFSLLMFVTLFYMLRRIINVSCNFQQPEVYPPTKKSGMRP